MNKKFKHSLIAAFFAISTPAVAGSDTLTSTVTLTVSAINELTLSSSSATLTSDVATAGSQPNSVTVGQSYSFSTNKSNQKIYIDTIDTIPANVSIEVNATAPTNGGTSNGWTTLVENTSTAVVTGIGTDSEGSVSMSVRYKAPVSAGTFSSFPVDVLFSIDD